MLRTPAALPAESAAVQARLNAQLAKLAGNKPTQTPALQVAIAQNGRIVYERAFGTASLDTRFPIASITKMFTAVAIMQLTESHRVDLDAKVSRYLPGAPYAEQITVRELLQHTSGLWNYGDYAFDSGLVGTPTTPMAILAMAAKHPLTSPPGTKWAYSNTGYVVLGLIVEHVSGESLAQYDREHILQPAGMTQTAMGNPEAGVPVAAGYMSASGARAGAYDPSWSFACGDIVSTASDLARFDIALLDGRLLASETFAQMQANVVPNPYGMQGLGIFVINWHGLQLVGHHGGVPGYEAENETIPARQLAWIVLSNAFDFGTPRASGIVISSLFPNSVEPAASTPEDRVVTERFREALGSLFRGKIDQSQFSDEVNAALTPQLLTQTATQLKPLGAILKVSFLGVDKSAVATTYSYSVTFSGGQTFTWRFILDARGKIAGIYSTL
ncbi:MAG: serine hydrolase domain-containing protein [Candidatus Cybelea sp.]